MSDASRVEVLGIQFDALTRADAAGAVVRLARDGGKHYVVKPYSEFIPPLQSDRRLRDAVGDSALCLADGVGILWAAHYLSLRGGGVRALVQFPLSLASLVLNPTALHRPLPQAMRGVDFTWQMLGELDRAGLSVYLLGGTEAELRGTAMRIGERLPGLRIAGAHSGHFRHTDAENKAVIAGINSASPDVLLVAMGFPRQERWIAANLPELNVRVAVAEGGSFTFISGAVRRAPRWVRRAGLEWLYRLARQPWRLRRQLALPLFVWLVLRARLERAGAQGQ